MWLFACAMVREAHFSIFFSLRMRKLLMSFFSCGFSKFSPNFIVLIHFPTYRSIDSHDLFYLNFWDSQSFQSSAKVAKVLQKFRKKSGEFLQNSAKVLLLQNFCISSAKGLQKFCFQNSKYINLFCLAFFSHLRL